MMADCLSNRPCSNLDPNRRILVESLKLFSVFIITTMKKTSAFVVLTVRACHQSQNCARGAGGPRQFEARNRKLQLLTNPRKENLIFEMEKVPFF
jgi:hypothetical protein